MPLDSKSTCRLDSAMPKTKRERQIVGFSLPVELARAIKAEAAQRGISLRDLMAEFWAAYQAARKGSDT